MFRAYFPVALLLSSSLISSCKDEGKKPAGPPAGQDTGEATGKPEADTGPRMSTRTVELERGQGEATAVVEVPSTWNESSPGNFRQPDPFDGIWPSHIAVALGGYSCQGSCTDDDFERAMAKLFAGRHEHLATPNLNTGDPEKDALRLEVTELSSGEIENGRFVGHEVRKPEGVTGPYFEGSQALCARFRPGDKYYLVTSVAANVGAEDEWFDDLVAACKQAHAR